MIDILRFPQRGFLFFLLSLGLSAQAQLPQIIQLETKELAQLNELVTNCTTGMHAHLMAVAKNLDLELKSPETVNLCPPADLASVPLSANHQFELAGVKLTTHSFLSLILRRIALKSGQVLNAKLLQIQDYPALDPTLDMYASPISKLNTSYGGSLQHTPEDRINQNRSSATAEQLAALESITTFRGMTTQQFDDLIDQAYLKTHFQERSPRQMGCALKPHQVPDHRSIHLYHDVKKTFPCLTPDDLMMLKLYIGSGYQTMNGYMRDFTHSKAKTLVIGTLEKTLEKLVPTGPRVVFRGAGFYDINDKFLAYYQKALRMTDLAFMSTSFSSRVATNFAGNTTSRGSPQKAVLMFLLTKTGVSLAGLNNSEEEVLVHPQTVWDVIYRKQVGNTTFLFAEEMDEGPHSRDFRGD